MQKDKETRNAMERISEYTVYHSGNIQALRCTVQKVTPAAAAPHPISPEMLRIVRIVSGACTWVISRREYRVGAGDIVILNNTEKRYQTGISPDAPVIQEVVRFMPVAFSDVSACFPLFFYRGTGFSHVFTPGCAEYDRLAEVMSLLRSEADSAGYEKDSAMLALVRVLIIGLYRSALAMGRLPEAAHGAKSIPNAGSYQVVWEAIVNIKEHLSEDISAAGLAADAGMSRSHFSRIFGAVMGMTIPQYIRLLRLRAVRELTESQGLNILEAVYAAGFGSTSAYYKALHELVLLD